MKKSIVIAVENPKGGPGKSTTCINLARGFQLAGYDPLLVCRDIQGTSRIWRKIAEEAGLDNAPFVIGIDTPTLHEDIKKFKKVHDIIIIDGAGKLMDLKTKQQMIASSVKSADIVLMPIRPSGADIWGCADLVDLVKARQAVCDGLPKAVYLVTQQKKGSRLSKQISTLVKDFEVPMLNSRLALREVYSESLLHGLTVYEMKKHTREAIKAIDEMNELVNELKELF